MANYRDLGDLRKNENDNATSPTGGLLVLCSQKIGDLHHIFYSPDRLSQINYNPVPRGV